MRCFDFDRNWIFWCKAHLSKCFHPVGVISCLSPNFCLSCGSTRPSSVPGSLTCRGRIDPQPVWVESCIFVKLTHARLFFFYAHTRLLEGTEYVVSFKAFCGKVIAGGCFFFWQSEFAFGGTSQHFASWSDCVSGLIPSAMERDLVEWWPLASTSWYSLQQGEDRLQWLAWNVSWKKQCINRFCREKKQFICCGLMDSFYPRII